MRRSLWLSVIISFVLSCNCNHLAQRTSIIPHIRSRRTQTSFRQIFIFFEVRSHSRCARCAAGGDITSTTMVAPLPYKRGSRGGGSGGSQTFVGFVLALLGFSIAMLLGASATTSQGVARRAVARADEAERRAASCAAQLAVTHRRVDDQQRYLDTQVRPTPHPTSTAPAKWSTSKYFVNRHSGRDEHYHPFLLTVSTLPHCEL